MLPVRPEIASADARLSDDALAIIRFGVPRDTSSLPMRQLGPLPSIEVWRSPLPVTRWSAEGAAFASNGEVLFGSARVCGCEIESAAARVYETLVTAARSSGHPHLLRAWNHVGSINACEEGWERYRRFSVGRHEALTRLGITPQQFPAASAVGTQGNELAVTLLTSRVPGMQVENPRQVPAYEYPAHYGPRSPSFARATVARWDAAGMIFVAGTSSVVGHASLHADDVEAQLEETLRNLETIIDAAAARAGTSARLDGMTVARTYLRRAADYAAVAARLQSAMPRTQHLVLESDICRRDLLIEIEGVVPLI